MLADLTKRKAYLFDLDGTIINSQLGIFNALHYTFDKMGMIIKDEAELFKFIGPSIGSTFKTEYGLSDDMALSAVNIYREYYQTRGLLECSAYLGIDELLKKLKAQGKLIGLATKKPTLFSKQIIENLNLAIYFDVICGAELDEHDDSKARIIENAINALNQNKSDCVMIGDTKYDAIAAAEVGVDCVGVLYGFGSQKELIQNGIILLSKDIPTLTDILTKGV